MAILKERDVRKFVEQAGGVVQSVRYNRHYVVDYTYEGKPHRVTMAKSPSCRRWKQNTLARMRKSHRGSP